MTASQGRHWAFKALWPVLVLSAGLAFYLGRAHIVLEHGTGTYESLCNISAKINCDAVNLSEWSALLGIPVSLWALPLYAAMAWLLYRAMSGGQAGDRARRSFLAIAAFNVLFSIFLLFLMATQVHAWCIFCLSLDLLGILTVVFISLVPGSKAPALPAARDLGIAGALVLVGVLGVVGYTKAYASHLDDVAIAELMTAATDPEVPDDVVNSSAEPGATDVQTERRSGQAIKLPDLVQEVQVDADDATLGPADAKVTVIEFADFECGYCKRLGFSLVPAKEKYKDRVRFAFKHFPMDRDCNPYMSKTHHESACEAATAAICAERQDQFWPYHDLLFKNQKYLGAKDLEHYAKQVGLDVEAWKSCLSDPTVAEELKADIELGHSLDITGTPRTYINGRQFKGALSEAIVDAAIRLGLGEIEATADGKVQTERTVVLDKPLPKGAIDMVEVKLGRQSFWMDAVEASVSTDGRAVTMVREAPALLTWFEARDACQKSGKRLCTQAEWLAACTGQVQVDDDGDGQLHSDYLEGRQYPYDEIYRPGYCNDQGDKDKQRSRPVGTNAACRTPEGVYDLTGNVQEWVGADETHAVLMGGPWYAEDKASCRNAYDTFGPGMSNRTTGFRCCSDSSVATPADVSVAPQVDPTSRVAASTPLPDFQGKTLDGQALGPDIIKGKVALVNFWASWCTPCRHELPALSKLYREFHGKGFEILAVNVDREAKDAQGFLARMPVPFPVLFDPDSLIVGKFDVVAMPTSVLVDKSGNIVEVHVGFSDDWFAELSDKVKEML